MTFGENLKTLRNARSLSQKELADELGFSFQNISKWERNESLPDIGTLLDIAKFFGTSTDSLLGYAPAKSSLVLTVALESASIFKTYPDHEEKVTNKMIFAVNAEGRIANIIYVPRLRFFTKGYTKSKYDPFNENSTVIYEYSYYDHRKSRDRITENKKIRIPDGGFLISMSNSDFTVKQIMNFIIPEEYHAFLAPESHEDYRNNRNGKFLFGNILKHNELDNITVELSGNELIFTKPAEQVDPMAVNIEDLAKIVRKELQKEHNKQIEELKELIEELTDQVEESEGNISDLEDKIEELEAKISELEEKEDE